MASLVQPDMIQIEETQENLRLSTLDINQDLINTKHVEKYFRESKDSQAFLP